MAKWIQDAAQKMEQKGTVGALHKRLKVAQGKKIPKEKLTATLNRLKKISKNKHAKGEKLTSDERTTMQRVLFARNAGKR